MGETLMNQVAGDISKFVLDIKSAAVVNIFSLFNR